MFSASEAGLPFFVYGTLCPGQPNYGLMRGRICAEIPAQVADLCLFSVGSFPMAMSRAALPDFVPNTIGGSWLHGYLMYPFPHHYDTLTSDLDQLENYVPEQPEQSEYHRVICEAQQADGTPVRAWIYLGNSRYLHPTFPLIPDGNWIAYQAAKRGKA